MSRIIKFRAWDSDMKFMINPYCELKDGRFWGEDCTNNPFCIDQENVMQYTGIKDKNGKEIYEGDLIKSKFIGEKPLEVVYDEDLGAFKMAQDGYYMGFMGDKNRHELEVVGNIYEP